MKLIKALLIVCSIINFNKASAQSAQTNSGTTDSAKKIETLNSHTFTIRNISNIKVVNMRLDGNPLPGPRYQIRGSYQPSCPRGMLCTPKLVPPKPGLLILRQWDYQSGSVQGKIMNICRRSIENAGPEAELNLTGKVIIDRPGSNTVVYLQSITSCEINYPKRRSV